MKIWKWCLVVPIAFLFADGLGAYPLDGWKHMGIRRLKGYAAVQEGKVAGAKLAPGALLASDEVRLHLVGKGREWDVKSVAKDPVLQKVLSDALAQRDPSYAVMLIDITDPEKIAWAGLREEEPQYPGSVNKVLCMIALFDQLRQAFPKQEDRERILRETVIEASDWSLGDWHPVPHFQSETGTNRFGPIQGGERFSLAEWVDHMISASANAAGSIVWKEAILLHAFGEHYPVGPEKERAFFQQTPGPKLYELSQEVINEPLRRAGIDLAAVKQGTFWTKAGQGRIPGTRSYASPRELARILLRLEQGRLVDEWSSREMKRFLYMTRRRYRYAYAPELRDAAIYFKSGSRYKCQPEEGFKCGKYRGNVLNNMNSIAIIESPARAGEDQKRYIVTLMSNVLRKNSAWDHARIAAAMEEAVRSRSSVQIKDQGSASEIADSGRGD